MKLKSKKEVAIAATILLIIVAALLLRFSGINFGLPSYIYHTDESLYANLIQKYFSGQGQGLLQRSDALSPFFWFFWGILFIVNWIYSLFFEARTIIEMPLSDIVGLGRIFIALTSVAIVVATIYLGRIIFNRWIGLLAGLVLAITFVDVHVAHYFKHDPLSALLGIISVIFAYLGFSRRSHTVLFFSFAAIFVILAGLTKIHGFLFAVPLIIAFLYKFVPWWKSSYKNRKIVLIPIILALLTVAIGLPIYLAGSYQTSYVDLPSKVIDILLHPIQKNHYAQTTDGLANWLWWPWYLVSTGLGYVLFFFTVAGFVLLLRKINKKVIIFLSFPLIYMLILMMQTARFDRWIVLATPFFAIISACFIYWLIRECRRKHQTLGLAITIIIAFSLLLPLSRSVAFDRALSETDTRERASHSIIKENIEGSRTIFTFGAPTIHEMITANSDWQTVSIDSWDDPAQALAYADHLIVVNEYLEIINRNYNSLPISNTTLTSLEEIEDNSEKVGVFSNALFEREFFGPNRLAHGSTLSKYHHPKISIYKIPKIPSSERPIFHKEIEVSAENSDRWEKFYASESASYLLNLGYLPRLNLEFEFNFEGNELTEPYHFKVGAYDNSVEPVSFSVSGNDLESNRITMTVKMPSATKMYLEVGPSEARNNDLLQVIEITEKTD